MALHLLRSTLLRHEYYSVAVSQSDRGAAVLSLEFGFRELDSAGFSLVAPATGAVLCGRCLGADTSVRYLGNSVRCIGLPRHCASPSGALT